MEVIKQMGRKKEPVVFHPLVKEWMQDPLVQKRPQTVKNYAYNIQKFLDIQKKRGKALPDIQATDLARFVQEMKENKLSSSTLITNYWSLRSWFEWLHDENKKINGHNLISDEKLKKMQRYFPDVPKNEEVKTKAISDEEVKNVFRNIHDPILHILFWCGLNYGLRAEEYIKLEMRDVDLGNKLLHIREGKGLKKRRIPILDNHVEIWEKWFQTRLEQKQTNHDFVFYSSTGQFQIRNLQRYFNHMSSLIEPIPEHLNKKKLSKEEKLELKQFKKKKWFTSHDLRRTFATNLYKDGVPILVISKLMGHRNINTTQIYLQIEEEELFDIYRKRYNQS